MRSLERLGPTASVQHGLLTRRQLLAAGFDRAGLEVAVRSGELHRFGRGVYATAAPDGSREQRILAGCLQARTVAAASHLCAAATWSLWTSDAIELSVRYPGHLSIAGGTVHRSRDLERRDITRVDGVPVTSPARTICDLGLVLPEFQVHRILDHALVAGLVAADEVAGLRKRIGRSGRNGAGVVGRALEAIPNGVESAESGPELMLARALATSALPPAVPQFEVTTPRARYRLDLAMPDHKVAIEYDGAQWHGPDRRRADARRQRDLEAQGWCFVRADSSDLSPEGLIAFRKRVLAALRNRRDDGRRRL
ncbi:MAG: type IV toxin-antitoxin system AbiEi family antitoxin domain-containing protein [Acidimicrobiales bacterium]